MDSSPGQRTSTQSDVYPAIFGDKKIPLLEHPSYSPNLAPCDFFLLPKQVWAKRNEIRVSWCNKEKSDAAHVRPLRERPSTLLPTVDNSYEAGGGEEDYFKGDNISIE